MCDAKLFDNLFKYLQLLLEFVVIYARVIIISRNFSEGFKKCNTSTDILHLYSQVHKNGWFKEYEKATQYTSYLVIGSQRVKYRVCQTTFFFENALKKATEYFLKFIFFYFKVQFGYWKKFHLNGSFGWPRSSLNDHSNFFRSCAAVFHQWLNTYLWRHPKR